MISPKYIAWVKDIGVMFPVKTLFLESNIYRLDKPYGNTDYMDDEIELMQFTGLYDKNGVEVYEGGVIKIYADNGFYTCEIIEKVIFKQGQYGIEHGDLYRDFCSLSDLYKPTKTEYISNVGEVATESEPMFEVIGNIYDNPELLEVEE